MERIREIEFYLKKEFRNINKSKYRSKTLSSIEIKRNQITEAFSEYKTLLKSFEHRLKGSTWNEEVEIYAALKVVVVQSTNIRQH